MRTHRIQGRAGVFGPVAAWVVVGLAGGGAGRAAVEEAEPVCADAGCVLDRAAAEWAAGEVEGARRRLAAGLRAFPDDPRLPILHGAWALLEGDRLEALDAFARRLDEAPDDCEARAWLAWAYLQFAIVDEAEAVWQTGECAGAGASGTRGLLVAALAAHYRGDGEAARERLAAARGRDAAYPADREALRGLGRIIDPERSDDLSWRIEAAGGYASNALLGAPTDPATGDAVDPQSPWVQGDLWAELQPDLGTWIRPALEVQLRGQWFAGDDAAGQSHLDMTGRLGVRLDLGVPRLLLAWRPDYLLLAEGVQAGGGPVIYFGAHRGEFELDLGPSLLVFGGAGSRTFEHRGRSRIEVDGGLGGRVALAPRLDALWTVLGRGHFAENDQYLLGGATLVISLQYRLLHGWSSRLGLTLAADWYPDSAGRYDGTDGERQDRFLRVAYALWTPTWDGVRLGVGYEYGVRDSTVPSYAFDDHRAMFRLSWTGGTDLGGPDAAAPAAADPVWLPEGEGGGVHERIQDLLRQEEQVHRSCGCAE